MGIGMHIVEALVREHLYRPIAGDVVMIGRQTVYFTPSRIRAFLSSHGIVLSEAAAAAIELDQSTVDRLANSRGRQLITDSALFRLLGVENIQALDRSDYEGANVIHDLNLPVTDRLKGIADLIVDGSTLDNTFNPALTLKNYCDMLRPGGRLLT